MGYQHTYFDLAAGLKETVHVQKGTCALIKDHIHNITNMLDLEIKKYNGQPSHWKQRTPGEDVDNDVASATVLKHNRWVRELYSELELWSTQPPENSEELTPEFFQSICYGLARLNLPYHRWSADTYVSEMQTLFEVMQGEEQDGITFEGKPLTKKQAAEVIWLFSGYLDNHDVRLELPRGCDYLVTSDDYQWCPKHGAIFYEDVEEDQKGNWRCPVKSCREEL